MIIINDTSLLGDALCALPLIKQTAIEENNKGLKLNLIFRNNKVYELMPEQIKQYIHKIDVIDDLWSMDPAVVNQLVYMMNVGMALQATQGAVHMMASHFIMARKPVPPNLKLDIQFSKLEHVEHFDYLISPYSNSDFNNNKLWPYENWQKIIDTLLPASIAVLRTKEDPTPFKNVGYIVADLPTVCQYLYNVKKAILTIDNGISHLTHAVNPHKHVLLYPACLHPHWVANPNAKTIRGNPLEITPEQFLAKIAELN